MSKKLPKQVGGKRILPATKATNPTGKGGFKEHPENRGSGHWSPATSVSYWYRKMMSMTVPEFKKYETAHPEKERTVAESLAYPAVLKARNDLRYLQEVTNRTEGLPRQTIDHTLNDPGMVEADADQLINEWDVDAPDRAEIKTGLPKSDK